MINEEGIKHRDDWHPAACIFPMMAELELNELADDIQRNGQREDIIMLDGKILDGRNRWIACKLRGITPKTVNAGNEVNDPVSYVLSLNLHRRHLTPSQSSMCAARARDIYDKQAKERQKLSEGRGQKGPANLPDVKGDARDAAGKAFGVSGKSVDLATRVIKRGIPDLAKAVDAGRIAVSSAAIVANDPPEEQQAAIDSLPNRNYAKTSGRKKEEVEKPEKKPKHAGEHNQSDVFALTKADVAITQLKGIPLSNKYRADALKKVVDWIQLQTGKTDGR
jgi:hypothetical protein